MPKPKAQPVESVDLASLTRDQLFAHYKKTDRIETLRFWARHLGPVSEELRAGFQVFALAVQNMTIQPAAFDRQFGALKDQWRRERNARDRAEHIAAGHVYDREFSRWTDPLEMLVYGPWLEGECSPTLAQYLEPEPIDVEATA